MGLRMNRQGHPETLVAAHHGNTNAVKAGVFSAALLATRTEEAERALAPLDPDELISDLLRSELARLLVLRDAMDQTLEEDGLRGRGGEPRNMINLRLRLNTRLLRTVDEFESRSAKARPAPDSGTDPYQTDVRRSNLLEEIALGHQRESLDLIAPAEFNPALFLATIVGSDDSSVDIDEQIRAQTMLTRWRANRATLCACFSTRAARDGAEFRGWIDELREAGLTQAMGDTGLAERVRALARGERLEPRMMYSRTSAAIEAVIRAEVERTYSPSQDRGQPNADRTDALNARLWRTMLSADARIPLRRRLKAFDALDKANSFRACTCGGPESKIQLSEEKFDSALAYLVRLAGGRHYRSAAAAVEFPEIYLAVRDAVDAAIRSQREDTE